MDQPSYYEILFEKIKDSEKGLKLQDNKVRFKTYKETFTGKDAVDWMISNNQASTREEAVTKLKNLPFENLSNTGGVEFTDNKDIYKFKSDFNIAIDKVISFLNSSETFIENAQNGQELALISSTLEFLHSVAFHYKTEEEKIIQMKEQISFILVQLKSKLKSPESNSSSLPFFVSFLESISNQISA